MSTSLLYQLTIELYLFTIVHIHSGVRLYGFNAVLSAGLSRCRSDIAMSLIGY